ncbi:hypothetical protein L2719_02030 [Shewanella schlegeliana]|uniref:Lipoprotein n=1 Tax=Shewanella schlegeliana TaxID=190308 RepID=A0ABS1SY26_9GAMM|nr:hypothetical protein [Shewanella schlegeliana]MBL4913455.1 hypothetical protein [Shewanella schlegeliana]MCL1108345.1 hypothetical protein [Shewanella schlegeliana]GIU34340.1 hypothetical protein TUM4433_30300 [Shewanella schlegeliana]
MNFKKATVATALLSSLFLVGCSSTSSNQAPGFDGDPDFENVDPDFGITKPSPELPPTDDAPGNELNHWQLSDTGEILKNGEAVGIYDPTTGLVWKDGILVASVEKNTLTIHGSNDTYRIYRNELGTLTIDWGNSVVDGDWGLTPPTDTPPENGINHWQLTEEGEVLKNGEVVGTYDATTGHITKDGVLVASVEKNTLTIHGSNDTYRVYKNDSGTLSIDWENSVVDGSWGVDDKKAHLKSKANSAKVRIKTQLKR